MSRHNASIVSARSLHSCHEDDAPWKCLLAVRESQRSWRGQHRRIVRPQSRQISIMPATATSFSEVKQPCADEALNE
jgi:hypothetical protein